MPAAHHPVFKQPADPGIAVWRYMDFTKFVAMLETRTLFFARSDKLGDPFEGSSSRGNALLRPIIYKELYDKLPAGTVEKMNANQTDFSKWHRQWTFINCWHMNSAESAAMWRLYAKTNEAIAIRSSFFRLANVLDDKTYVGRVEYIDFERDWMPEGNTLYPFIHKRRSFSHETEVRALFTQLPTNECGFDFKAEAPKNGIEKSVNMDELIEQVYVGPTSPDWFRELVQKVSARYGLQKPIVQSSLDAEPFF